MLLGQLKITSINSPRENNNDTLSSLSTVLALSCWLGIRTYSR